MSLEDDLLRDDDQADDRAQVGGDIDCRGVLSLSLEIEKELLPYSLRSSSEVMVPMVCLCYVL